jgi:hypothetical protein
MNFLLLSIACHNGKMCGLGERKRWKKEKLLNKNGLVGLDSRWIMVSIRTDLGLDRGCF